ncbi:MAG: VCBS repeat-containing protein [Planctomycetes bacterium]|nr:VCBS repeat-containing protein [Planctomycetota bacterium]
MRHAHAVGSLFALLTPLLAQSPSVRLDAPVVVVDQWSRIDELADLDLDGDLDGVGFYDFTFLQQSGQPSVLQWKLHRNDGTGRFDSSVLYQWPQSSGGAFTHYLTPVGDLDGDGHADVLMVGTTMLALESRPGQPVLRTLTPLPLSLSISSNNDARLVDITGDGRAELVVIDTFYGLRIFNLGTSTYSQRAVASPAPSSTEMALIEANGDASMDVAVLHGGTLRIYPTNQTGTFTYFASFALPAGISTFGPGQGNLVAGDVDGDGDQDMVVFSMSGTYCWLERTGPSQFTMHAAAVGGPATNLHDVDGDGDLDGTCCGGGGPTPATPNNLVGAFEIAQNLGGGVFAPAWRMPSIGAWHLAGFADMNGDGYADLVGGRNVYFGPVRHDPLATTLPSASTVKVVDCDHDGDPDLVSGTGAMWSNYGQGVFTSTSLPLPPAPPGTTWQLLPGTIDFDRDGDDDCLATTLVAGSPIETRRLDNTGGGFLVDRGPITPPGTALSSSKPLAGGDLDGDGDLDVLTTDASGIVRVWWQHGGALALGPSFPASRIAGVADFTGDGRDDVLLASYPFLPATAWADLQMLTFPSGQGAVLSSVGTGYALDAPGITDHDGDGDLDLIALNYNGTFGLYVWQNNGVGTFTMQPNAFATASVREGGRVSVADMDGDGLEDYVVGPAGYPHVVNTSQTGFWVVRRLPGGQFESALFSPEVGAPADVDGDGDLDLLGAAVVKNRRFDGPSAGNRSQFGDACPGTGGARPVLGTVGPFRANVGIETRLTGGLGGSAALVIAALAPAIPPIVLAPDFVLYLDPSFFVLTSFLLGGTPSAAGEGSGSFTMWFDPGFAGFSYYLQAAVFDPGVPTNLSLSNAVYVRIGS